MSKRLRGIIGCKYLIGLPDGSNYLLIATPVQTFPYQAIKKTHERPSSHIAQSTRSSSPPYSFAAPADRWRSNAADSGASRAGAGCKEQHARSHEGRTSPHACMAASRTPSPPLLLCLHLPASAAVDHGDHRRWHRG